MSVFEYHSRLDFPADVVYAWHLRPAALERLIPPWESLRILGTRGELENSSVIELQISGGRRPVSWVLESREARSGTELCMVQVEGPFTDWNHTRRVVPCAENACDLHDRVSYSFAASSWLQALRTRRIVQRLKQVFAYGHRIVRNDLTRHDSTNARAPLRIALSGSGGLVGRGLTAFLRAGGHEVMPLVRPGSATSAGACVRWDPRQEHFDAGPLEGIDALVHLAGESIASGRWTRARKRAILESRVKGTRQLCQGLVRMRVPPRSLISASAIGYYGNRGEAPVTEESEPGSGFLAEVCQAWEEATRPARERGIRVVNLRSGIVLSARGGALPRMLPAFRAGLGGVVGHGNQVMSWIAREDLIAAIYHLICARGVHGPVNAVAPQPQTNREFTRILGAVLRRPTFFPLPSAIVRGLFGELGTALLLEGARVSCGRLQASGFEFFFPDLREMLCAELGRPDANGVVRSVNPIRRDQAGWVDPE